MFAEAFHSMIKGLHLALEVKTSFDNSTHATGSSTKSSTYKPGLPLTVVLDITGKKRRTCTQKVTKQSLSNYGQQD
jgi:hypothetical protein